MKRNTLTIEQHKAIGPEVSELLRATAQLTNRLRDSYSTTSLIGKKAERAFVAVKQLHSTLEADWLQKGDGGSTSPYEYK